jgi:hypothetical protein
MVHKTVNKLNGLNMVFKMVFKDEWVISMVYREAGCHGETRCEKSGRPKTQEKHMVCKMVNSLFTMLNTW